MIRLLLPGAIVVFVVLGFLRWEGEQRGLYGTATGVLLLTLGAIGVTAVLLWGFAGWLDRNEAARRVAEANLRRSSRYFDLSRDLVCTAGFDGVLRDLNAVWTPTLGWSEAELRSRPFLEFVHPDDREITARETAGLTEGGVTVDFVNRYATKDGGWRWLDWKAIAVAEEGLMYASARDITQRKEDEAALEAGERQTRQIVETAHDAFIAIDERGLVTDCNPQAETTFGWAREEMLGRELAELIIPEGHREAHRRGIAHFLASGEGPALGKRLELVALDREGREFPIELAICALRTQEGWSFNAFLRDITQRKTAEETVERQRRQLIEAQSVGQFGSWEWDVAADSVEWSPELYRIYGIEPGQDPMTFEVFLGGVHADDRCVVQALIEAAYQSGEAFSFEHRLVRPGGSVRVVHARGEVIMGQDRTPVRMHGTGQDITEQKAAQEARGRLAAVVDCSEDAILTKTPDGIIETWNRSARELFGYTAEEAVGQPIAMLVPADRQDELAEILAQINRGERVEPLETVRVARDGHPIDVSLRISLISDAAGNVIGASSISRDITQRKLAEIQLRRDSRYFELSRDLTAAAGFDGHFMTVNPALTDILGWTAQEFLARPFIDMVHPDDRAATLAEVDKLADGQVTIGFVNRYEAKDGSYRWLDWNAIVSPDEPLMYCSGRDITERTLMEQALREAEQRFRTAFDGAPIGVCLLSLDRADPGRVLQANPALAELLGRSVDDLDDVPINSLMHPEDHAAIHARLATLTDGRSSHIELEKRLMHRSGHPVWALISAARLPTTSNQPAVAVTHVMDISDRKRFEGQLQHLADHDALTGLFNRRRFNEEVQRALMHAKRFGEHGAVLFLDLDGFKFVNDSLGHAAGDELIIRVAKLLAGALRETDTLARVGGDEFAILLPRCDQAAAMRVAEKLLVTLRRAATAVRDDRSARVSSSIGIALFADKGELTADEIVVEADIAMYDAKEAGKDRYAIYDHSEGRPEPISIRENWNDRLSDAVENDRFVLHAQTIIPICSNGVQAFELLLRLPDDHGDLIPPAAFLSNAERFGVIEQIDRWVLHQAVAHLHASHAAGHDLMLSVNVSGKTMGDPTFGAYVARQLAQHSLAPQRLMIEITETAAITNIGRARTLARELQTLGCRLALDDFGAGFASFYYLKHLNFDYLKIDGEFIANLRDTPTDRLVVEAVVSIARGLNTRTIAEFVGDSATLNLLRSLGVDYGQGYHLGRPAALKQTLPYLISPRISA
ncbi:MAG TPA: PAS domain S-box protein [Solirubrobacteraceae bacterium]|nr:PAS domain S-box protein [Solirubrobacteraceae bacterium]